MKAFIKVYQNALENAKPDFQIKWDRELSKYLKSGIQKEFKKSDILVNQYRPFIKQFFYLDKHFNGQPYQWFEIFRTNESNTYIALNSPGNPKGFFCLGSNTICDLHLTGDSQCLPFYKYGSKNERIDNITDWSLLQFKKHYGAKGITKEAIFHYVYAVLHDPIYREKYALNLKREFPRIPFYADFAQWAKWGKVLMDLHIGYESVASAKLNRIDTADEKARKAGVPPKAMLKADRDAGTIVLDSETTLSGVPDAAWDYRLGNRSALEWILDQYKEKKPKDPTIREKFDTYRFADYKEKVIDLLQRVTTVSVETMKIVDAMKVAKR